MSTRIINYDMYKNNKSIRLLQYFLKPKYKPINKYKYFSIYNL